MSKLITGSINVSKIKKELQNGNDISWKNKDDIMVNISIWINDEPDKYGNDASISVGKTKEKTVHIGSGLKFYKKNNNQDSTAPSNDNIDDLPF